MYTDTVYTVIVFIVLPPLLFQPRILYHPSIGPGGNPPRDSLTNRLALLAVAYGGAGFEPRPAASRSGALPSIHLSS